MTRKGYAEFHAYPGCVSLLFRHCSHHARLFAESRTAIAILIAIAIIAIVIGRRLVETGRLAREFLAPVKEQSKDGETEQKPESE
jgi:hypothetical protein